MGSRHRLRPPSPAPLRSAARFSPPARGRPPPPSPPSGLPERHQVPNRVCVDLGESSRAGGVWGGRRCHDCQRLRSSRRVLAPAVARAAQPLAPHHVRLNLRVVRRVRPRPRPARTDVRVPAPKKHCAGRPSPHKTLPSLRTPFHPLMLSTTHARSASSPSLPRPRAPGRLSGSTSCKSFSSNPLSPNTDSLSCVRFPRIGCTCAPRPARRGGQGTQASGSLPDPGRRRVRPGVPGPGKRGAGGAAARGEAGAP